VAVWQRVKEIPRFTVSHFTSHVEF